MPNVKTNEAYAIATKNLASALKARDELQVQQALIDEQIEDATRCILGFERLVKALEPAVNPQQAPMFKTDYNVTIRDKFNKQTEEALTELEKITAIETAA